LGVQCPLLAGSKHYQKEILQPYCEHSLLRWCSIHPVTFTCDLNHGGPDSCGIPRSPSIANYEHNRYSRQPQAPQEQSATLLLGAAQIWANIMKNIAPQHFNEVESDRRGVKDGWYAISVTGRLVGNGPFSSREDCSADIKRLQEATIDPYHNRTVN
jgi:hypothetical protein